METTWTFASGLKIPVTFEILENCSADVILGENMLWENSVFKTYSASIREMPYMPYEDEADELFELAPFSYKKKWQQKASDFKQKILSKSNRKPSDPHQDHTDR